VEKPRTFERVLHLKIAQQIDLTVVAEMWSPADNLSK
jgi:hypothetical protein